MGIPVPDKKIAAKKNGKRRTRKKKTRKKRGGSPLPPVPYDELKITLWNILRNNVILNSSPFTFEKYFKIN